MGPRETTGWRNFPKTDPEVGAYWFIKGCSLLSEEENLCYPSRVCVVSFFLFQMQVLISVICFSFHHCAIGYIRGCLNVSFRHNLHIRASLTAQLVKNPPAMQETPVQFLGWEDPLEKDRLPTPVFLGFPCGSAGKESTCNAGDLGSIPGLGRSPGEGKGYLLQYSGLENSMDCIVHGVIKSWTRLSK